MWEDHCTVKGRLGGGHLEAGWPTLQNPPWEARGLTQLVEIKAASKRHLLVGGFVIGHYLYGMRCSVFPRRLPQSFLRWMQVEP